MFKIHKERKTSLIGLEILQKHKIRELRLGDPPDYYVTYKEEDKEIKGYAIHIERGYKLEFIWGKDFNTWHMIKDGREDE